MPWWEIRLDKVLERDWGAILDSDQGSSLWKDGIRAEIWPKLECKMYKYRGSNRSLRSGAKSQARRENGLLKSTTRHLTALSLSDSVAFTNGWFLPPSWKPLSIGFHHAIFSFSCFFCLSRLTFVLELLTLYLILFLTSLRNYWQI